MNLIGRMLANRYEILEKIGNGGMATVYKAKCHVLNRFVAVKVLKEEFITDIEFIKRFKSEAQTAASLTHPNIVSIYDVGNEGDVYYIVMELIQGKTLKEIIVEDGKLSWKWSVNIAIQIASALETAHKNNLIHRDIKPHNIIITEDGMAKVTDFGIAKAVSNSTITAFGTTIGSVHYFSPEHARGGNTDAKSDIYSLGVVMYEMLTGRVPFDADTPVSVALMQVQDDPIEPKKLNPQIPISVNNIILKAMQKEPEDRYQNATDMLIDLSTALKRPNDDFVKLNKKFDTLQTQKLNTLYDIDGKIKDSEEDYDDDEEDDEEYDKPKRKRKGLIGFLKDHVIISFVLIAIILFSVALGGTILFMNLTKSDDAQIPNLVKNSNGERLTEAQAISVYNETEFKKKNSLKVEYIEDETYNGENVEPGQVVKQDPPYKTNYKIKVKDQITIYVRKAKEPKKLKMIDLTGKTKEEAEQMLKDLGYLGEVKYLEEPSESLKEGLIIKQTIQEGIEFNDNEEITLTVSTGSDKLDVPDTTGQASDVAKIALENAGFVVRMEYTEDTNKSDGIVLKQDIVGKNKADEGEIITITVNKVQKTVTAIVTVDLSKYVQPQANTPTDPDNENNTTPSVTTAKVELKVGNNNYGGTYDVTTSPQISIEGKGNMSVSLVIDGVTRKTKDIDFNTQTSLAFP
ncbi:MAG: Stk1 family PASTA domain-containing Ser/Thr kinase [Clostridia bacterium]|jgi:serine/threonine protein kinase|nr:Stk1 family PASTA domain-containing Ser/Thr kinase [Clostridia bacterium]